MSKTDNEILFSTGKGVTHKHKITNSYSIKNAYRYYRKNRPDNKMKACMSDSKFYSVIRKIHKYLAKELIDTGTLKLPYSMGELRTVSIPTRLELVDGKLITNRPINWKGTKDLWRNDSEALQKRILVRYDEDRLLKVVYIKTKARYINKNFFKFETNSELKRTVTNEIKNGKLDTFIYGEILQYTNNTR